MVANSAIEFCARSRAVETNRVGPRRPIGASGVLPSVRDPMFCYPEDTLVAALAPQDTVMAISALQYLSMPAVHWIGLPDSLGSMGLALRKVCLGLQPSFLSPLKTCVRVELMLVPAAWYVILLIPIISLTFWVQGRCQVISRIC